MGLLQELAEIPAVLGELQLLSAEVKEGLVTQSPGIEETIEGVKGRLALIFTPDSVAQAATVSLESEVKAEPVAEPAADVAATTEGTSQATS
jgi:hypothetical protein